MTDLLTALADDFGPALLAAAWVFAFAESAFGIGSLVPGEAVILALGTSVSGPIEGLALLAAVTLGATTGDHVGYALGRRQGERTRTSRPVTRLGVQHWDRAADLVRRHGPLAVIGSRLLPVVRTLTPAVAGASGLPYRPFVAASVAGSMLWAGLWVTLGTFGGPLLVHAVRQAGIVVLLLLAAGVTVATAAVVRRRRTRAAFAVPTRKEARRCRSA